MGNTSAKPHPRSRHKKQVHWRAADRPAPPGKPQLVAESEITPDVVTIRWDPPKYDGGSPVTGYLVEHRRYGSPHWVRATPLLVRFTELSLSGLEPGWRYQFRVSAENAVGLSVPGELSELLTVTLQRSAVTAPRFIDELIDTVVLENEKVEFIAQFLGQPAPKICWFKDGFEIFSSRRIRISTENDRSVLTIYQSSLSDEGEIKCTATNRAGHASTRAKLTLEAPPSIRLPKQYEDGLLFELGEVMRLKVSIAGRPTPLVFWSHNNEYINNGDKHEIETTDKFSSIRVEEVQRTDRGEYHIKAVNKLGEAVDSFLVTVTDKPAPPGRARVVMTLGRSVTLSWGLPTDDGGCKIGNYIVEYFRLGWDVWLKAATCRQLTTTIGELIEGSEYKFRIKAESPYGISEPSEESDVVFIPDPKRGILTPSERSRSQPRDIFPTENKPVATKRKPRSQSSTRAETASSRPTTPLHFYEGGIPVRPARTKIKSPSITPELSPILNRRTVTTDTINRNIFDRSSMARDLAYGSPEIKVKKTETDIVEPTTNTSYYSNRLNQLPNTVIKSTVNVIHHQNVNLPEIHSYKQRQRSPSPKSTPPTIGQINQKRRASSPRPLSPTSESKLYKKHKSPNPKPIPPTSESRIYQQQPRAATSAIESKQKSEDSKHKDFTFEKIINQNQNIPYSSPIASSIQSTAFNRQKSLEETRKRTPSPLPQVKQRSPSPVRFSDRVLQTKQRPPSPVRFPGREPQTRQRSPSPVRPYGRIRNKSPSPLRSSKSRSPSPNKYDNYDAFERRLSKGLKDRNDPLSNSSEFMLVLLPEQKKGRGSASDVKFDFDENSVPPPLSLSAPELGAEPLSFEPLRTSVSSTELLHEHAMARFYDAMAAEEEERNQVQSDREDSSHKTGIPKIQINSRDDQIIVGLERKNSFRRRLSAGTPVPQQLLWAQRRHSLRNSTELPELPQNNLRKYPILLDNKTVRRASDGSSKPETNLRRFPMSLDDKREIFSARQRSESEEREEEEFEKVRAKMAVQKKERKAVAVLREEDWFEDDENEEFEKVRAKIAVQKKERKTVGVLREEDWFEEDENEDPEYEESLSESETESSEDERRIPQLPPIYADEEEEVYHPGLMHRRINNKPISKSDEPFEILTKPNPLPDPNFRPKPILKHRGIEDIPEKPIRTSISTNNSRQRSLSAFPKTNPKEAGYDLESSSRQRSFSLFPQNTVSKANLEGPAMRKRGSSPTIPFRKLSAVAEISGIAAASVGMPQPQKQPVQRKKSDEEIKVVVEHYGDIVRSYGQKKRTIPQVYLNADDLKAAAERQSREDLREIARSVENLANPENQADENLEELQVPTDTRRRSFVMEASSAFLRTVKQGVSAVLAGNQEEEDDIIPPDAEIIPSSQRRGSAQVNKRRPSKSPNKLEAPKAAKKAAPTKSNTRGENWSNLRAPSPNPQGRKASPTPMRRTSLVPPTAQARRNSLTGVTAPKPKTKEITTQTAEESKVLLAAQQEDLTAKAELKVRSTVDYITDLAMFAVACWLYLFQNELLAIPVLLVMVYRQLKEKIKKKLSWMSGTKKVKQK